VIFNIMKPSQSSHVYLLFLPNMAKDSYRTDKDEADSLPEVFKEFDNGVSGA
jgi:hypothetical protein